MKKLLTVGSLIGILALAAERKKNQQHRNRAAIKTRLKKMILMMQAALTLKMKITNKFQKGDLDNEKVYEYHGISGCTYARSLR